MTTDPSAAEPPTESSPTDRSPTAASPDLGPARCPSCDAVATPDDRFCEECGERLVAADGTTARCVHCGAGRVGDDGYCDICGLRRPEPDDHVVVDLGTTGAGVSDKGHHHHRNEDAMALAAFADPAGAPAVVGVVCDGVSTSFEPQRASRAAADAALRSLGESVAGTDPAADLAAAATLAAVEAAAEHVAEVTRELAETEPGRVAAGPPGCTYATALMTRQVITVGWVGDSRAYWLAADGEATPSVRLTADDSWAAEAVAEGLLPAAEAYADPRAHTITRWLGIDYMPAEPHVATLEPRGSGTVLLCTDGLWNYVEDPADLAAVVAGAASPREAADALVRLALDAGGHDNVTVVLVPFPPEPPR